jgi:hypothetical protein
MILSFSLRKIAAPNHEPPGMTNPIEIIKNSF